MSDYFYNTNNVVVDLETLGTKAGCVILSIGAAEFEDHGVVDAFYRTLSIDSQTERGLKIEQRVLKFWLDQDAETRGDIFESDEESTDVLTDFSKWCNSKENLVLWGNSARFDLGILEQAYTSLGFHECMIPWDTRNGERCYKTLKKLYPEVTSERTGVLHNALDDACFQAEHLIKILKSIKKD